LARIFNSYGWIGKYIAVSCLWTFNDDNNMAVIKYMSLHGAFYKKFHRYAHVICLIKQLDKTNIQMLNIVNPDPLDVGCFKTGFLCNIS
jgi:hypothetical protein